MLDILPVTTAESGVIHCCSAVVVVFKAIMHAHQLPYDITDPRRQRLHYKVSCYEYTLLSMEARPRSTTVAVSGHKGLPCWDVGSPRRHSRCGPARVLHSTAVSERHVMWRHRAPTGADNEYLNGPTDEQASGDLWKRRLYILLMHTHVALDGPTNSSHRRD